MIIILFNIIIITIIIITIIICFHFEGGGGYACIRWLKRFQTKGEE